MHRKGFSLVALAALLIFSMLAMIATAQDDIQQSPSCTYCGMDRHTFDFSRMMIEYEDGTSIGTCSLHCAAVEFALNIDRTPKAIQVADYGTKALVDAEKAAWVLGGKKQGVMSKGGKWAFKNYADAEAFIKTNGGTLASFDEIMKAAYNDMYDDTKMIREKRKMMKMKKKGRAM